MFYYQPLNNDTDVTVPWKLKHVCHILHDKCDKGFSHQTHNFCTDYKSHTDC